VTAARWALPIPLLVALTACGGGGASPTAPSAPTSFLTGTWRGTITVQVNPGDPDQQPEVSGPAHWTFEPVAGSNLQSFRTTVQAQHPWFAAAASGSTTLTPGNAPPASISTLGGFDSPRGCRGTFGSVGTAQATRIEADFTGTDCQAATFTGRVVLTKQ
jgi:hypothetical protein